MKGRLLILGAGLYGKMVYEIALDLGYSKIDFLDDYVDNAVGRIEDCEKFVNVYDEAIVAIDDQLLRIKFTKYLQKCGYVVPRLIHPMAYVADTASIGIGTIVEPMAVISTRVSVGKCCFISAGAVLKQHVTLSDAVNIGCNCIVMYNSVIKQGTKIGDGELFDNATLQGTSAWLPNYSFDDGV